LSAKNVVLVHGAWADGSSWSAVIQHLQDKGYSVTAAQIQLEVLTEDVTRVRQILSAQTGPTVLATHSFGGAVITALGADAPNVVSLVYVAAFAPDKGETMKGLIGGGPQPPGAAALRPDAFGNIWLDPEGVLQFFAPDIEPAQACVLAAVQKPIAASEFLGEEVFGEPAWKFKPSWYLVAENDQMVPPPAQQFFAKRMGATTVSIASSHVAMIAHPDAAVELIEQAAQV
jgi:pimeloyl-ACP methyl ester carboxylesterase